MDSGNPIIISEVQHLLHDEVESSRSSDEAGSLQSDVEAFYTEKPTKKAFFSGFRRRLSISFPSERKNKLKGLYKYAVPLLPSFLHPAGPEQYSTKPLRKTAALDGLRGVSALCVVIYHFFGYFYDVNVGYVLAYEPSHSFWNLPFVKTIYNGSSAVHIFFVISGYILSLRSLQHMKKQNLEGVVKTLSSSTFRRSARLLAPLTITMFIEALALQMGMFEHARSNPAIGRDIPPMAASLYEKLIELKNNVRDLGNIFQWGDYHNTNFDDNLWTIGFEYRCSMAIFLLLLCICRIHKPWIRRTFVISLMVLYRPYARWDFILFMIGMVLADFDAWSVNDSEPTISGKHQPFWAIIALIGIFMCAGPINSAEVAIGYGYITQLGALVYPWFPYRFAWSIGAGCMVAAAMHSIYVRWVLETKFVQYLGKISYMLYVVHGPLLRSLGFSIVGFVWGCMSSNVAAGSATYVIGVLISWLLFLPVVFWLADRATRLIDDNCVSAARWIEDKCIKID